MNAAIFDLDQQHCDTQDVIAESLFINGESDGFEGRYPACKDFDYLAGYLQGIKRFSDYVQRQALLLQQEAQTLESMFADLEEF